MGPIAACRAVYGANPFPEAVQIASYIRVHTSNDEKIAVLGSEPEIYFYSGRRSATGYIYTYGLMENQKYALKMQKEMAGEIEAAHPKYVVYVDVKTSWLRAPKSETFIFDWAQNYLERGYDLVNSGDIFTQPEHRLESESQAYSAGSASNVTVFKRRSQ